MNTQAGEYSRSWATDEVQLLILNILNLFSAEKEEEEEKIYQK